jgi:hypothetical protein
VDPLLVKMLRETTSEPETTGKVHKGQLISKANSKLFIKTNENIFAFLAQPLKVVQSRKYKINV